MLPLFNNENFIENQEVNDIKTSETIQTEKNPVTNKSPTHDIVYDYMHTTVNEFIADMPKESIIRVVKSLGLNMRLSYNKNICQEIEDYFIMDISCDFDDSVYETIGVLARNLIPDIIRIRRKVGYFKLKLVDARRSKEDLTMINYKFISVDEDSSENNKVTFERYNTEKIKIIINQ